MAFGRRLRIPLGGLSGIGMAWLLVGLSVALAIAAVLYCGLRFEHAPRFLGLFGGLLGLLAAINIYQRIRMPENARLIFLIDMITLYMTMATTMMIYQSALATLPAIPISDLIERLDHAVGFDWMAYASFVGGIHPLSAAMEFCYTNWMREFVVALAVMAYLREFDDMCEFTFAYVIAGMATLSVTAFFDAKSYDAVATYAIANFHHPVGVGPEYLQKLTAMRSGLDRTLDFDHLIGLVSFPSFHAGSALLLATATRNLRWLWAPFFVFNLLIILGTISEGGHNLMDVLGGCAFAIGGLYAAGALSRRVRRVDAGVRASAAAGFGRPSATSVIPVTAP